MLFNAVVIIALAMGAILYVYAVIFFFNALLFSFRGNFISLADIRTDNHRRRCCWWVGWLDFKFYRNTLTHCFHEVHLHYWPNDYCGHGLLHRRVLIKQVKAQGVFAF